MIFQKEEWSVKKDPLPRVYAAVFHNRVEVVPLKGAKRLAYIQVPSDLFLFAHQILQLPKDELTSFALDEVEAGWVFSLVAPDGCPTDLWLYRVLPPWAV